jgi:hypothetical protein
MTLDFEKKDMKELRRLADAAYERELADELAKLEEEFRRWRSNEMSAFELSDRIHEFHDGAARDLWKIYTFGRPPVAVARAIANGLIAESALSPKLLAQLEGAIAFYRQDWVESAADDEDDDD